MAAPLANELYPSVNLDQVNIFLAEDNVRKADDVKNSLDKAGLLTGDNLTIASTFTEAERIIELQVPGSMLYNVFLLDGNLDADHPRATYQGAELMGILYRRYVAPIQSVVEQTVLSLQKLGLNSVEQKRIITARGVQEVATNRLASDALFVGISIDPRNELPYPAQVPWAPYKDVGQIVFDKVLPAKERRRIAAIRHREHQQSQAETIRAERAARRTSLQTEEVE